MGDGHCDITQSLLHNKHLLCRGGDSPRALAPCGGTDLPFSPEGWGRGGHSPGHRPTPRLRCAHKVTKTPSPPPHTTPTGLQCLTMDSSQKRGKTRITTMEFSGNPKDKNEERGTRHHTNSKQGTAPHRLTHNLTQRPGHLSPCRPTHIQLSTKKLQGILKGKGGKQSNDVTDASESDPVTTQEGNLK